MVSIGCTPQSVFLLTEKAKKVKFTQQILFRQELLLMDNMCQVRSS